MEIPLGNIDHVHAELLGDHLIGDGHGVPLERQNWPLRYILPRLVETASMV